ncbi:OsmC family protein [Novosphingobium sp. FKTRR1]|uniref:OsmC family protein n=1 Tax=Novosphingobium sp. FKTRR1 TaxID=2879118 RepID=UPI001CF04C0B|nr:OsmC family protein [Novosphingobium sp. FKTRR1]
MASQHTPNATATTTGEGLFQSALDIAGTPLIADEPLALGGLDTGPNPYDLLCAALATCTTMTLRFYANRKGWDIGEVSTHVTHHRDPALSPADRFERTVTLSPTLDQATREALLGIANRCPVHNTLVAGSNVATALAGA